MLIAIMGDSFANFMELRDVNTIRTKLQILAENSSVIRIRRDKSESNKNLMFVVKPCGIESGYANDNWSGSVNKITKVTERLVGDLRRDFESKNEKLRSEIKHLASQSASKSDIAGIRYDMNQLRIMMN